MNKKQAGVVGIVIAMIYAISELITAIKAPPSQVLHHEVGPIQDVTSTTR